MCAASLQHSLFLGGGGDLAAVTSLGDAEKWPQATASSGAAAQAGEVEVKVKSFHCKQNPGNKAKINICCGNKSVSVFALDLSDSLRAPQVGSCPMR